MKVCQIIPAFRLAGAETMCESLCIGLSELGNEVIAISMYSEQTSITERLKQNGIRVIYLDKVRGLDIKLYSRLYRVLKKEQPDIIHTHIYTTKYVFPITIFFHQTKFFHTVHNIAQEEASTIGKIINFIFFRIKRVKPVALSPEIRNTVADLYHIKKEQIPIIQNGIDLQKCIKKCDYHTKDIFTILHIGRFMEVKNHRLIISSFSKISKVYPNVQLQFIGEGELEHSCIELVYELGLQDKVRFLGKQENVFTFLTEADVFILPSAFEGFPMSLIEAMGTGLPIVASNVGGIPNMLQNRVSALLIQPLENELVSSIIQLINDENMRRELGERAYEQAQRFSMSAMSKAYQDLYLLGK